MAIDLDDIKRLIDLAAQTGVATLDVTVDGMRVRIETAPAASAASPRPVAASPIAAPPSPAIAAPLPEAAATTTGTPVRAPTDGLIHLSPSPGAAPFVTVGKAVEPGETLCLIEVMKMFYPVAAPAAGRIGAIRVEDGRQVAFDEVLFDLA